MNDLYRLSIHHSLSLESAWNSLKKLGIEILYGSEEEGKVELYAYLPCPKIVSDLDWITSSILYPLPPIDWEAQWATHGLNFHDGYVHIDFSILGRKAPSLRLQPGSGFGDLSHPTSRLMLLLLARYHHQQIVIDIGCGSGILTLAAALLGAPSAYGIDIDESAIEHSRQNALLNLLENRCFFCTPDDFVWKISSQSVLILMNMIQSEQLVAWSSLPSLHAQPAQLLSSGIRIEEREAYLAQMSQQGWILEEEEEENGWLAFYFTKKGAGSQEPGVRSSSVP